MKYNILIPFRIEHFSQDEIPSEIDANARQSLDEISKELNDMKLEMSKKDEPGYDSVNGGGNSQRAIIGEIETIKKIADILETVILPAIVDSGTKAGQTHAVASGSASVSSDPIKILPKGLKLLQHHSAIGVDDGLNND